jgi:hypothetical protein
MVIGLSEGDTSMDRYFFGINGPGASSEPAYPVWSASVGVIAFILATTGFCVAVEGRPVPWAVSWSLIVLDLNWNSFLAKLSV